MIIQTQETLNPNVMNFFPDVKIINSGVVEFANAKEAKGSPLAEKLFDLDGVENILVSSEMVSVTKEGDSDWTGLKPRVLAVLMEVLTTGEPAVKEENKQKSHEEIVKQIKGLLDARIRPAVAQDGGDIVFAAFENGILYVEMQGSCNGCPYAMVTLKEGVEKVLKSYIPEVKAVEAV